MADEEKKIIVDDDWKEKAQKEKEELKKQASEKPEEETKERPPLPPANFPGLVSMLATQVFFALGLIATEENKEVKADLEMAKFNIDMLAVLEEKTKGNLSDEEEKMLTDTLSQLRMAYVQVSGKGQDG
mgnify:CR=1 FL=1